MLWRRARCTFELVYLAIEEPDVRELSDGEDAAVEDEGEQVIPWPVTRYPVSHQHGADMQLNGQFFADLPAVFPRLHHARLRRPLELPAERGRELAVAHAQPFPHGPDWVQDVSSPWA